MSTQDTVIRGRRDGVKKFMSIVDRVGLALLFVMVFAGLPGAALSIFTRTV